MSPSNNKRAHHAAIILNDIHAAIDFLFKFKLSFDSVGELVVNANDGCLYVCGVWIYVPHDSP